MSWRVEPTPGANTTDIVISGFESGIADSAYDGIADMRNVNIISVPGEASVNFKTSAMGIPPSVSTLAFTVAAASDTATVATTASWYNGMAITINSLVGGTGLSTGRVYWVGNLTATTFKFYKSPSLDASSLVDVTVDGSGTLSSYTLSAPLDRTLFYSQVGSIIRPYIFILDSSGRVWWVQNTGGTITNNLVYLGNDTLTGSNGRAVVAFNGYLIVFRETTTDYLQLSRIEDGTDLDSASGWTYGWESVSNLVGRTLRPTIVGQDNGLYFANDGRVGSFLVNAGSSFAPGTPATYTKNTSALLLPNNDDVMSFGELGIDLLVGGLKNLVYPWDRSSSSFRNPLVVAENLTSRIVTTNANAYLFAGSRGRIYITNGSNVELYKKVPDTITGTVDPYFIWNDAWYWRNQLYFSFSASGNDGVSLESTSGLWAIDVASGALRFTNKLSYGAYTGSTPVIVPNIISATPGGGGLYAGWSNGSTYGVDYSVAVPYSGSEAYVDLDLIPVGLLLAKRTFEQVEFKLSRPLVSGESVVIYYRTDLNGSFTQLASFTTAGVLSGYSPINSAFEKAQWVQLRVVQNSTSSSPSYVRLREIRLR